MFLSHKDKNTGYEKLLSDHLKEVFHNTNRILKECPINKHKASITLICRLAALTHDFGKYTSFFQEYLETGKQSNLKQHSFISALLGSFLLTKMKNQKITIPYAELILYVAILHHHGNLRIVSEDLIPKRDIISNDIYSMLPRVQVLEKQVDDIRQNLAEITKDYQQVLSLVSINQMEWIEEFLESWIDTMDVIYKQHYQLKRNASKNFKIDFVEDIYYYLLLIYSVLLNADKFSAADITPFKRLEIPVNIIDEYRSEKFDIKTKEGINGWRNKMYDTVMSKIENHKDKLDHQRLYTLTAPTGAGKTLLSLSVAFKWRNWIKEKTEYCPRIIYALPFTSIIDQNELQIRDILKRLTDYQDNQHRYLIKHHHLTNIEYINENEELPLNQSLLLTESWESEVIVTTFIQLFYTLIGYENRTLKKFHQITGSIIILDEIQNIPVEYWPLLRTVLRKMADLFSCTFILLTATQPLIFEKGETIELLEDEQTLNISFFKVMERVTLFKFTRNGNKYYEVDEWVEMFKENFEEGKDYLSIFNTISTSLTVYKELRPFLIEKGYEVFYLSTNIIPLERKQRIEKIKRVLKSEKKVVVISTQVVEAGVDLDFDIVYRDLGPIDSIVQAAGRCNRHGILNKFGKFGEIRVTPIARNGRFESTMVYKGIHTSVALELLPSENIKEHHLIDLIEKYYEKLVKQKPTDDSEKILEAMAHLRFSSKDRKRESLVSDFCLIPENPLMIDTFVEVNEEAEEIWDKYLETVIYEQDFKKRFEANLQIKSDLSKYVISAPIKIVKNLFNDEAVKTRMIRIPRSILNQYYNNDYGLIRSIQDGEVFML